MSEPSVGLVPDGPFVKMLTKCDTAAKLPVAAYISLTGTPVDADEMMRLGLVTHRIDGTEMDSLTRHLSSATLGANTVAVGDALDLICGWQSNTCLDTAAAEVVRAAGSTPSSEEDGLPFGSATTRAAIASCFSGSVEEAWSKLEGMEGEWASNALSGMARCPALSLVATHRLLAECRGLSGSGAAALSERVATRLAMGSCFGAVVEHGTRGTTAPPTTLADLKAVHPDEVAALFER